MSRTKLSSTMDTYLPLARQEVLTLLMRLGDIMHALYFGISKEPKWALVAGYLSHNIVRVSNVSDSVRKLTEEKAAAGIIESIWRKWDIDNDRPLPDGVERVWNELNRKHDVVWSKSETLYYAPRSASSS
jgi:hypothetical protein